MVAGDPLILRGVRRVGGPAGPVDVAVRGAVVSGGRDGRTIDLRGSIAFPGLVNSHDHLELDAFPLLAHGPYRDWRDWARDIHQRDRAAIDAASAVPLERRIRAGILRNLACGVTTVVQHGPWDPTQSPISVLAPGTCLHSVAERGWRRRLLSPRSPAPFVVHLGEGTSGRARREIDRLCQWNLWRRQVMAVHAVAMRPDQARRFAAVVWCPVSNEILLGTTAPIAALKARTRVLFGTDSTLTGPWSVWDHLRRAREIGALTDRELLEALGPTATVTWGLPRSDLRPGAPADLVVARATADQPIEAFFAVRPRDIQLVLVGGRVALVDEALAAWFDTVGLCPVNVDGSPKRVAMETDGLAVVP